VFSLLIINIACTKCTQDILSEVEIPMDFPLASQVAACNIPLMARHGGECTIKKIPLMKRLTLPPLIILVSVLYTSLS